LAQVGIAASGNPLRTGSLSPENAAPTIEIRAYRTIGLVQLDGTASICFVHLLAVELDQVTHVGQKV